VGEVLVGEIRTVGKKKKMGGGILTGRKMGVEIRKKYRLGIKKGGILVGVPVKEGGVPH